MREIEKLLENQGTKFNEDAQFFREKIRFIQKESSMMDILQKHMGKLLDPREDLINFIE
jgi:hypothetical protein